MRRKRRKKPQHPLITNLVWFYCLLNRKLIFKNNRLKMHLPKSQMNTLHCPPFELFFFIVISISRFYSCSEIQMDFFLFLGRKLKDYRSTNEKNKQTKTSQISSFMFYPREWRTQDMFNFFCKVHNGDIYYFF